MALLMYSFVAHLSSYLSCILAHAESCAKWAFTSSPNLEYPITGLHAMATTKDGAQLLEDEVALQAGHSVISLSDALIGARGCFDFEAIRVTLREFCILSDFGTWVTEMLSFADDAPEESCL